MKLPKYIKVASGFCKQANVTTYEGAIYPQKYVISLWNAPNGKKRTNRS